MKVEVIEFKLCGLALKNKTTNENGQSGIDCGNLWQQFESQKLADTITNKLSDEIYAVYYNYDGDHIKPFSYFIGCKVSLDATIPQNMESLSIPNGTFVKKVAKGKMPDCIADAWKEIWRSDMKRLYKSDFEVYDHRSKNWDDAEVDIFISVEN